nr:ATP-binding cassette domain-containing protein [Cytophagales bacterium]
MTSEKSSLNIFRFFQQHVGNKLFISLILSVVIAVFDTVGIALFLPLFQIISNPDFSQEAFSKISILKPYLSAYSAKDSIYFIQVGILLIFLFKGLFKFVENIYRNKIQESFIRKIRFTCLDLLSGLEYESFLKIDTGRIQNTLTVEVFNVTQALRTVINLLQSFIFVLVYFGIALILNPIFTLLVIFGSFLVHLIFKPFFVSTKSLSVSITQKGHKLSELFLNYIQYYKYFKATASNDGFVGRIKQKSFDIEEGNLKKAKNESFLNSFREPLIIFVLLASLLIQTLINPSGLATSFISIILIYRGTTYSGSFQSFWNSLLSASGAVFNMTDFINELNGNQIQQGAIPLSSFDNQIQFKNVDFFYGSNHVLKHISFEIKKNTSTAFVGVSGSGKTTIANLVSGLLKLKDGSGQIAIDGISYDLLDKKSLQKRIGYVTQEPVIFADSFFNNVTLWDEKNKKNLDRFRSAIALASLLPFYNSQSFTKDTMIGSEGVYLSGGQLQRIAIARELYKGCDILVFDEATSSLDPQNEQIIKESIEVLKKDFTLIIIAHKFSLIKDCDRIIYLEKGKIEDHGSFDELVDRNENFNKMVDLQKI